jgi:ABC-type lipoprotein export system ATPase subunit
MEVCTQTGQGATTLETPMPMAWSSQKVTGGKRTIEKMETSEDEEELEKEKDDHLLIVFTTIVVISMSSQEQNIETTSDVVKSGGAPTYSYPSTTKFQC